MKLPSLLCCAAAVALLTAACGGSTAEVPVAADQDQDLTGALGTGPGLP